MDARNPILVRAMLPADAGDNPRTAATQVYEILDGHHRFAALLNLQTRNMLPAEFRVPVTVLTQYVPNELIIAMNSV
jgi:ParB-like chromosome segregation protein Spo0J